MIHVMLPVQYLQEASARLAEPEKRLALAVLLTVVYDCGLPARRPSDGKAGARSRQAQARAMAYVTSGDRSWPYSFENLCDTIGVDAGYLRRGIGHAHGSPE